jgi:hypothetical protein
MSSRCWGVIIFFLYIFHYWISFNCSLRLPASQRVSESACTLNWPNKFPVAFSSTALCLCRLGNIHKLRGKIAAHFSCCVGNETRVNLRNLSAANMHAAIVQCGKLAPTIAVASSEVGNMRPCVLFMEQIATPKASIAHNLW